MALSFYKRFFFCARILDDPSGTSLALNRIGITYFKLRKISKSMKFHMRHSKVTDTDNAFLSYYNIAICHRILGDFSKAYWYFSKALEWTQFRDVSLNKAIIIITEIGQRKRMPVSWSVGYCSISWEKSNQCQGYKSGTLVELLKVPWNVRKYFEKSLATVPRLFIVHSFPLLWL